MQLPKFSFEHSFLRSKVARRIFGLFVLCALLPLSGLAYFSYRHVTAQLYRQADQRLHQASKAVGMTVFERLLFLEADLQMIIAHHLPAPPAALVPAFSELRERLASRFTGLGLVSSGRATVLLEPLPSFPQVDTKAQQHLAAGRTLVLVSPHPGHFASILMVRALYPAQPLQELLVGEINPAYLWGGENFVTPTTELFVLDQARHVLFSSLPDHFPSQEMHAAFDAGTPSGRLVWTYQDDTYLAGYWTLFVRPYFLTPEWVLVHSQSRAEILEPLHNFTRIFLRVTLLAFWVVMLLSFRQIRRYLVPIDLLRIATQRMATRDFGVRVKIDSNDEFAALGRAFNDMAESLEDQLASLQHSEKRHRDLVEHSPGAICMHDLDGTLLFVNQAWAHPLGYAPADMVGRNLVDLLVPTVRHLYAGYLEQIRQEATTDGLARLTTKDGKERLWMYRSLRYEEAGKPPYVFIHAQDVTERKQLEAQLHQAQKLQAIGTLAGGIAHDFNNILTAILGYTELTLDDVPSDSVACENLHEVLTAGHRAKDLVQQILTFSRQGAPERTPIELHLLVKEVLKLMRASLPATIDIRVRLEATAGAVLADATQMHQVLMNLCTNAGHAMQETGGVLEVCLRAVEMDTSYAATYPELRPGPYVCLTVRDTGHGMPPEVLERIFEPFFTTKGIGEGTGMGLAVVHGIVTNHDGAITVVSIPGQGTTFEVYLPRLDHTTGQDVVPDAPIFGRNERILFVDDEPALASLGRQMLTRLGYQVTVHTSSDAALSTFRAAPQHFDLVITDQTMPHMTGEALTHELRHIRPDIPIILCTGFSYAMHAEKAQALGIDAFCLKPLRLQNLSLAIRRVLTRGGK